MDGWIESITDFGCSPHVLGYVSIDPHELTHLDYAWWVMNHHYCCYFFSSSSNHQVADGARATLGINVHEYIVTDEPLGVKIDMSPGGASWGTIARPDALLRAASHLIRGE